MERSLTPDVQRVFIALAAIALVTIAGGVAGQHRAIIFDGLARLMICHSTTLLPVLTPGVRIGHRVTIACIVVFAILLNALPLAVVATSNQGIAFFDAFYRMGVLMFGAGHLDHVVGLTNANFMRFERERLICKVLKNGRPIHDMAISKQVASSRIYRLKVQDGRRTARSKIG